MSLPHLTLLSILEDLDDDDFKAFKWHLINHSTPVPRARLDKASRTTTVDKMFGVYGSGQSVLSTAAEILREMKHNDSVEKLKKMSEGEAADGEQLQSTDGKPATALASPTISLSAEGGASIISPIVTAGSIGTININKRLGPRDTEHF